MVNSRDQKRLKYSESITKTQKSSKQMRPESNVTAKQELVIEERVLFGTDSEEETRLWVYLLRYLIKLNKGQIDQTSLWLLN